VAVKIVKSAKHYTEAARDEIKILSTVTRHDKDNSSCVIPLLDSFDIEGPHGTRILTVTF
jgi:serine/threonine-protein kinase SRPK3